MRSTGVGCFAVGCFLLAATTFGSPAGGVLSPITAPPTVVVPSGIPPTPNPASSGAFTLPPLAPDAKVTVAETCPGPLYNISGNFDQLVAEQAQLLPTLGAVQTYAKPQLGVSQGTRLIGEDLANPSSSFGRIGMAGPADRQVVFLEATGSPTDLQRHADALTKLVPRPDRLVICPTILSESRRHQIVNTLMARFYGGQRDPRFYEAQLGSASSPVEVNLRSDGAGLATQLRTEFGGDIAIRVGHFKWPDRTPAKTGNRCGTVGAPTKGLSWSLPKKITVRAGEPLIVKGSVRNTTARAIEYSGFKVVVVDKNHPNSVVAESAQNVAWTLSLNFFSPNALTRVSAWGATDPCTNSGSWTLTPGNYYAVLVSPFPGKEGRTMTSPPFPLVVREPAVPNS